MFAKAFFAAFLLTSLPSAVHAASTATIKNECPNDVYVWTVSETQGAMQTVPSGGEYSQGYLTNPDGGGVSMKISNTQDLGGPVTQFEYTLDGMLWYDISNINGYPFMASGLTLIPSDPSCRSVVCQAGVELCSAAYNTPDENAATAACGLDTDTTLVLCSGQKSSTPVASASDIASDVVASAAPVASPAPVAAPAVDAVAPKVSAAPKGVHTTFLTAVVTVVPPKTTAAASADDAQDWSFAHHPASLGADWGFAPLKRDEMHKRSAHRHHFRRHVGDSK